MGKLFNFVFRVGAVLGIAYAAKKLADNKETVKQEYAKAKEDPKAYAQNVQEKATAKAQDLQAKAQEEYAKAKEDPQAYRENVQNKVTDKAKEVQSKANEQVDAAKVKASDLQSKAKDEYAKAKEDPEAYKQNLKEKGKEKTESVKNEAKKAQKNMKNNSASADVKPDAENTDDIEQRESVLADEGGISESEVNKYEKEYNVDVIDDEGERNENHNIHIVTDNKKDNK